MTTYKEYRPICFEALAAVINERCWPTPEAENEREQLVERLRKVHPATHYTTEMILEIALIMQKHSKAIYYGFEVEEIEISQICYLIGKACPTFFIPESFESLHKKEVA